ncbi:MAG: transporter, partial [Phyllobacteriaceae bacterium]|nr:transporter [Phyllobacteriaceae bacterium]
MTHKRVETICICFAAALLSATSASAGGFALREQSAKGQGSSFAGVAAGSAGLSSLFWNPAISAEYNEFGFISESNASLIVPYSESELPGAGNDSGNVGVLGLVPASYYSYAINDQLTIAAAIAAPLGMTTDATNTWAGALHGDKSSVRTYNFNPTASYKVNDWIALGLGAQIEYMTLDMDSRIPGIGTKFADIEADSVGFGLTAGVLLTPADGTSIGLGFRSSISHTLKGKGFTAFPSPILNAPGSAMQGEFDSPELVTLGLSQQVTDQLKVMAGVEWSNWSRFKELRIHSPGGDLFTPENWKDGWFVSAGAEYAYSDVLDLRAGVAYEKSPVPDATRTPRIPDNDRYWLSLGASYKFAENM